MANYIRELWLKGLCPCCAGSMIKWEHQDGTVYEPEFVADMVMLCGRCIGNEHTRDDPAGRETLETILRAIADG
jgi:hypothetical protein